MNAKLLKSAAREVVVYLLCSGAVFVANATLYVAYFLVTRPKYTFLAGNTFVVLMMLAQCMAAFWYTCVRRSNGSAPDLPAFRYATSCVFAGLLILYGLHATVFTIVERSVSINVLRYLSTGESRPYPEIEKNFIETFVLRDKGVCKRLDEQVHLGNVSVDHGRYALTERGMRTFRTLDSATKVTADKAPKNAVSCDAP
ncbi:MAG: hypothetical protein KF819_40410 [Labilithrix sp.]|nr:hypothetical protein [Labilithrix sp.]